MEPTKTVPGLLLAKGISGLAVRYKYWTGKDKRWLFDKRTIRDGALLQRMLEAAIVEVEAPGPYHIDTLPKWADVATTDMMSLLLEIRKARKPILDMDPNCRECGERLSEDGIEADLQEITIHPMKPAAIRFLRDQTPMIVRVHKRLAIVLCNTDGAPLDPVTDGAVQSVTIPACSELGLRRETVVLWEPEDIVELGLSVLRGQDLKLLSKRLSQVAMEDATAINTASRAVYIKNSMVVGDTMLEGYEACKRWVEQDCDAEVQAAIDRWTDMMEGGPDMEVEIDCVKCRQANRVRVPFAGRFFGLQM